jgi:hypothetical protein
LLPDFYSGATGLSGCFVRDFLSGALIGRCGQRARTVAVACRIMSIEVPPSAQPMSVKVKVFEVRVSGMRRMASSTSGVAPSITSLQPLVAVEYWPPPAMATFTNEVHKRRCSLCHDSPLLPLEAFRFRNLTPWVTNGQLPPALQTNRR